MTSPSPDPDLRDVLEARAGDTVAYVRLVRRYARRVHDVARRWLRDEQAAEDVAQQVFWNAWRALPRFDVSRPFRNWLLRIATNEARGEGARRGRRPADRGRGGEDPLPEVPAPRQPALLDGGSSPALRHALDRLPERYRLVMILHYAHHLPLADIAEITGTPVATVKTHLHRGRSALRDLLLAETPTSTRSTTE